MQVRRSTACEVCTAPSGGACVGWGGALPCHSVSGMATACGWHFSPTFGHPPRLAAGAQPCEAGGAACAAAAAAAGWGEGGGSAAGRRAGELLEHEGGRQSRGRRGCHAFQLATSSCQRLGQKLTSTLTAAPRWPPCRHRMARALLPFSSPAFLPLRATARRGPGRGPAGRRAAGRHCSGQCAWSTAGQGPAAAAAGRRSRARQGLGSNGSSSSSNRGQAPSRTRAVGSSGGAHGGAAPPGTGLAAESQLP